MECSVLLMERSALYTSDPQAKARGTEIAV